MKLKGALLAMVAFGGAATAVYAADRLEPTRVTSLLKARLPKTQVSGIDCNKVAGLCEVVAGKTLFYVDGSARYLIVGRVYDMESRQDLTAAKLLEMNPDMLLGGAAKAGIEEEEETPVSQLANAAAAGRGAPPPAAAQKVDLSKLPASGAILWGKPSGTPVTIFTDLHCGFCRALANELEQMNVRVIERPISTLGTRDLSNRVYCAKDKPRALRAAYAGAEVAAATCDTSGLDANENFARTHGFSGTPVLVRSDGTVLEGYRPRAVLETWLKGAK
jgi:thiol:disulfide interchange protein DsbC